MNDLRTFDPRLLLGDRPELTLYRMFVEAYLSGDYQREADLYARFIKHFPGERAIHSPDQFITLIESMRQKGFDWYYPIRANPKEYTLCEGSHRCAIAMALNMNSIPYITSFHDNWVGDDGFRHILGERDFKVIEEKREQYISLSEPDTQLKCWLRLHMRNNPDSFTAPFSSPNALKVLRPYQSFEVLGIPGKRPSAKRIEIYNLLKYVDRSTKVLDIGCNVGFFGLTLAPNVGSLLGIDIDSNYISVAERFRKHCGIVNANFVCASVLDFHSDERYDLIISTAVHGWIGVSFEHYISTIVQWANPDGMLLIESHELDAHRLDWPQARDFLLTNFEVLEKGLIDDIDTSIYESEFREFLLLRKRPQWHYGEWHFEQKPITAVISLSSKDECLEPNLKVKFWRKLPWFQDALPNLIRVVLRLFPVRFRLVAKRFLNLLRKATRIRLWGS